MRKGSYKNSFFETFEGKTSFPTKQSRPHVWKQSAEIYLIRISTYGRHLGYSIDEMPYINRLTPVLGAINF